MIKDVGATEERDVTRVLAALFEAACQVLELHSCPWVYPSRGVGPVFFVLLIYVC